MRAARRPSPPAPLPAGGKTQLTQHCDGADHQRVSGRLVSWLEIMKQFNAGSYASLIEGIVGLRRNIDEAAENERSGLLSANARESIKTALAQIANDCTDLDLEVSLVPV